MDRSPILRFCLEVLIHAFENYFSGKEPNKKFFVLNISQAVELIIKAALVEGNVSIYENQGRTMNPHEALKAYKKLKGLEIFPFQARIEILIDERNAIQHRYGNVDDITLDYHLETAFRVIESVLKGDFDVSLSEYIKDNTEDNIWKNIRFIEGEESQINTNVSENSPSVSLVDGFSKFESEISELILKFNTGNIPRVSSLDFSLKVIGNTGDDNRTLIENLPKSYKLRNKIVHGEETAEITEIQSSLEYLKSALVVIKNAPSDLIQKAFLASSYGMKGINLSEFEEFYGDTPEISEGENI